MPDQAVPGARAWCHRMEASLVDAHVRLEIEMGGLREETNVRVWQSQVLVDWERDEDAGGCLLRPALVGRLLELGARVLEQTPTRLRLRATPRILAALGPGYAGLAIGMDGSPTLELTLRCDAAGTYLGGVEEYRVGAGRQVVLMRLEAWVSPRPPTLDPGQPPPLSGQR